MKLASFVSFSSNLNTSEQQFYSISTAIISLLFDSIYVWVTNKSNLVSNYGSSFNTEKFAGENTLAHKLIRFCRINACSTWLYFVYIVANTIDNFIYSVKCIQKPIVSFNIIYAISSILCSSTSSNKSGSFILMKFTVI